MGAFYDRGINPTYEAELLPDPFTGIRGGKRPSFHGTPIYVNDLIETRETPDGTHVSNIYFMVLGDSGHNEGRGLKFIVPPLRDGSMFDVRETPVMTDTGSASTINVDVTWPVGISIGSKSSLAMLKDVIVEPGV